MSKPPKYWSRAKRILSKKDKVMKKLISNYKDGSLVTRNDVFFSLCKSIIGQQISVAAANSVFLRFKKKYSQENYYEVKKIVTNLDIPFIDINKLVFDKQKNKLELFPFEKFGHYNVKGYKYVAEAIYNFTKNY